MYSPKQEVSEALNKIQGVVVAQAGDVVFNQLPALTFNEIDDVPDYDLDENIVNQEVMVMVDVWTNTSVGGKTLSDSVIAEMKKISFYVDFSGDIPNPDKRIYHKAIRFKAMKV